VQLLAAELRAAERRERARDLEAEIAT